MPGFPVCVWPTPGAGPSAAPLGHGGFSLTGLWPPEPDLPGRPLLLGPVGAALSPGRTLFTHRFMSLSQSAGLFLSIARSRSMMTGEQMAASHPLSTPNPLERPIKMGWLKKQRSIVKNWQQKYFVLRARQLYYYKDEEDLKPQVPAGRSVPLARALHPRHAGGRGTPRSHVNSQGPSYQDWTHIAGVEFPLSSSPFSRHINLVANTAWWSSPRKAQDEHGGAP